VIPMDVLCSHDRLNNIVWDCWSITPFSR